MPPSPPTSLKIEDLRARVRADAKSRHFYPLAEELRKIGRLEEAEQTLRTGLIAHPTYLSGWISLGRVLRDGGRKTEAAEFFLRALTIDPGNVVAARLAADNYLELNEKVEAIKKYKLVHALMPSDEEVESIIDALDKELNPQKYDVAGPSPLAAGDEHPLTSHPEQQTVQTTADGLAESGGRQQGSAGFDSEPVSESFTEEYPKSEPDGFSVATDHSAAVPPFDSMDSFTVAASGDGAIDAVDVDAAGAGMSVFEMPAGGSEESASDSEDALQSRSDSSEPVAGAPPVVPVPLDREAAESVWDDSEEVLHEESRPAASEHGVATLTIGDLYAQQGHHEAAREIYAKVAEREPGNEVAAERLRAFAIGGRERKIERLQRWVEKVGRRGTASV